MKPLERISQHSFLPGIVRDDGLVLDLGGNRGEFARAFRNVVAVEPTPVLASHLRDQGVEVIEAAVSASDGTASFTFDPSQELTGSLLGVEVVSLLKDRADTIEVPTLSLATLTTRYGPPDLVKVDIEGAELDMLLTASDETLLSVRQFTVEFHDFWYPELAEGTERAKQRLTALGFWSYRAGPNNKDVLFVHPDHVPNLPARAYIALMRWPWFAGRVLRELRRRLKVRLTSPTPELT